MFSITDGKGFHITFENGVTVSVQFGAGNYCSTNSKNIPYTELNTKCEDAEVAVWDNTGAWITSEYTNADYDDVIGYQTPEDVLKILNWASKR